MQNDGTLRLPQDHCIYVYMRMALLLYNVTDQMRNGRTNDLIGR